MHQIAVTTTEEMPPDPPLPPIGTPGRWEKFVTLEIDGISYHAWLPCWAYSSPWTQAVQAISDHCGRKIIREDAAERQRCPDAAGDLIPLPPPLCDFGTAYGRTLRFYLLDDILTSQPDWHCDACCLPREQLGQVSFRLKGYDFCAYHPILPLVMVCWSCEEEWSQLRSDAIEELCERKREECAALRDARDTLRGIRKHMREEPTTKPSPKRKGSAR